MTEVQRIIEHSLKSTDLLEEVVRAMDDSDCGYVPPDIYLKIMNHIGRDDYPDNMQKQIDTYEELYGDIEE